MNLVSVFNQLRMVSLNIHPIFVHFPIALLSLYAVFEILSLPMLTRLQWWFPTKAVLLFAGMIGGLIADQTGELAEAIYRGSPTMSLIRLHSTYAEAALWVYGVLAALYFIECLRRLQISSLLPAVLQKSWQYLIRIEQMLFRVPLLMLGSIAGLIIITIAGALGGAITYGPNADPIVSFIYHLFFQ